VDELVFNWRLFNWRLFNWRLFNWRLFNWRLFNWRLFNWPYRLQDMRFLEISSTAQALNFHK
jgi:hypothetical protein